MREREQGKTYRPVSCVESKRERNLQVLNTDMSDLMLLMPWYSYITLLPAPLPFPPAASFQLLL
jgi:hypothetical protein